MVKIYTKDESENEGDVFATVYTEDNDDCDPITGEVFEAGPFDYSKGNRGDKTKQNKESKIITHAPRKAYKDIKLDWDPPDMQTWGKEVKKDPPWIIPGLLPYKGRVVCSGQSKLAMKSYFTTQMLFGLVTGKGPKEFIPVDKSLIGSSVLAVQEESNGGETYQRFVNMMKGTGIDWKDLKQMKFSFHDRVKLDKPDWHRKILANVKYYGHRVVLFDPYYKLHDGDENKTDEVMPILNLLEEIRALGATTIMVVHLGKGLSKDNTMDVDMQIRGSGTIANDYDAHWALRRYNDGDPIWLRVRSKGSEDWRAQVRWGFDGVEINGVFKGAIDMQLIRKENKRTIARKAGKYYV